MRLAVNVQRGSLGIDTKANGAILVSDSCKWDTVSEEQVSRKQSLVAIMSVNVTLGLLAHQLFQLRAQTRMRLLVVRGVLQDDPAIAIESHAIVGVWQIFRRQPETQCMFGHEVESPARRYCWCAG